MTRSTIWAVAACVAVFALVGFVAASMWPDTGAGRSDDAVSAGRGVAREAPHDVADATGFTRMALSESYVVIVRVSPERSDMDMGGMDMGEMDMGEMDMDEMHMDGMDMDEVGMVVDQSLDDTGLMRHVTAHIYGRATGLAVDTTPRIIVSAAEAGTTTEMIPMAMQDASLGSIDTHFGQNVAIAAGSNVTITVVVAGEEVTVDGFVE